MWPREHTGDSPTDRAEPLLALRQLPSATGTSGKRSDATRNIETILDASVEVLSARPEASMAEIARASGLSRQTVYAHFPSRESLLDAVAGRALDHATTAIDAALAPGDDPLTQLRKLIPAWWGAVAGHARVLDVLGEQLAGNDSAAVRNFHGPILSRLEDLALRGQSSGKFDRGASPGWLASAYLGLVHTAAAEVAQGRMASADALAALETSIPRVFGVPQRSL